jgi:ribonuclease HIII
MSSEQESKPACDYSKLLYARPTKPASSREESINVMKALMGIDNEGAEETQQTTIRPALSNVFGMGPLFLSDLHESTKNDGVVVGIDEAGRGSVLGPMIYGAAFWNASSLQVQDKIPKDFNDSKQLTEDVRAKLLDRILETPEIGFAVRVLHASEISRNMLR